MPNPPPGPQQPAPPPGWWLAADGKWYPPQGPPVTAPKKSSRVPLWIAIGIAGLCAIGGLASLGAPKQTPETAAGTATTAPPAVSVAPVFKKKVDGDQITVLVPTGDQLREVFDAVVAETEGGDGYWVSIDCDSSGTDPTANRLATGRFAVSAKGRAQTGLEAGEVEFEANEERRCPSATPTPPDPTIGADEILTALTAAGINPPNQRDNTTPGCTPEFRCSKLITTDILSIYEWADQTQAAEWAAAGSTVVIISPTVNVRLAEGGTTPPYDQAAVRQVLANLANP